MSRAAQPVETVVPIVSAEDIPSDWYLVSIRDVTDAVSKVNPKDEPNKEIQYIDISGIDNEKYRIADTKTYIGKDAPSRARQLVQSGDIVFSTVRTYLKNFALVPAELNGQVASTGFCVLRASDPAYQKYLFYFIQFDRFLNELAKHQRGTSYPAVRDGDVRAQYIPMPPPEHAGSIVAEIEKQFSRLDEAVASLKRVKANLKRYKAAVLKAAVEGKLTEEWRKQHPDVEPASKLLERILTERRAKWEETELAKMKAKGKVSKDDKWKEKYKEPSELDIAKLANLPDTWVWSALGGLGEVIGGLTKNQKRKGYKKQLPYLRVGNVYANELRLDEIKEIGVGDNELDKLLVEKGDLLIVEGNGSPDQIGRLAIWDGSISPCVHQNHLIKVRLSGSCSPGWCVSWLLSPVGRSCIREVASSTSGLYTLSVGKISAMPMPLPPEAEQKQINDEIDQRLSILQGLENQIASDIQRAERTRQSILATSFSGCKWNR